MDLEPGDSPVELSTELLTTVRKEDDASDLQEMIRDLDPETLENNLQTNDDRTAFWLNLYNAYVQIVLKSDPSLYDNKRQFFGGARIPVAGHTLSLDAIEHGMLRKSLFKYGLGYVPNPFPGGFERRLRVHNRDPRIHFALNCGAQSCPPIAAYTSNQLDEELDIATKSYLHQEVSFEPTAGKVYVPRLFLWFRGDFGGKSGILELLRDHDVIPGEVTPRLKHKAYDWSLALDNYRKASIETRP